MVSRAVAARVYRSSLSSSSSIVYAFRMILRVPARQTHRPSVTCSASLAQRVVNEVELLVELVFAFLPHRPVGQAGFFGPCAYSPAVCEVSPPPRRTLLSKFLQRCRHEFVRGLGYISGNAMVVIDRGDPGSEGGDGVCPLPGFGAGVGGVDELGGDCDRVRRQRHVTIRLAPVGEASPRGRVGLARSLGA